MGGRGIGTNPEELLVCAVASCYAATLFGVLGRSGLPADSLGIDARGTVGGYPGQARFERILVSPTIVGGDPDRVHAYEQAAAAAHDRCFIGGTIAGNVDYQVGPGCGRAGAGGVVIEPPPTSAPPALGPLSAPSESEAAAAYPGLRNESLALARAAEALGRQPAQLLMLAREGRLLLVPGPWPMRQADHPGYFVPAWQLQPGARGPYPELPALLAAAAARGWTSLELHRFMTSPLDGVAPAAVLRAGDADRVAALIGAATTRG